MWTDVNWICEDLYGKAGHPNAGGLANSFSASRIGHPLASSTWPVRISGRLTSNDFLWFLPPDFHIRTKRNQYLMLPQLLKMRPFSSSTVSNSAPCRRPVLVQSAKANFPWNVPATSSCSNMAALLVAMSETQQVLARPTRNNKEQQSKVGCVWEFHLHRSFPSTYQKGLVYKWTCEDFKRQIGPAPQPHFTNQQSWFIIWCDFSTHVQSVCVLCWFILQLCKKRTAGKGHKFPASFTAWEMALSWGADHDLCAVCKVIHQCFAIASESGFRKGTSWIVLEPPVYRDLQLAVKAYRREPRIHRDQHFTWTGSYFTPGVWLLVHMGKSISSFHALNSLQAISSIKFTQSRIETDRPAWHPHLKRFKDFWNTSSSLGTSHAMKITIGTMLLKRDEQSVKLLTTSNLTWGTCCCHFAVVDVLSRAHVGCVHLAAWLQVCLVQSSTENIQSTCLEDPRPPRHWQSFILTKYQQRSNTYQISPLLPIFAAGLLKFCKYIRRYCTICKYNQI